MRKKLYALGLILTQSLFSAAAIACPLQSGLIDFNCDGVEKIAFVGDSFVQGIGDTDIPNGGYFARVAEHYPDASVVRYGVPGVTTSRLYSLAKRHLRDMASGPAENDLTDSDVVVIDVGRNDYYADNSPPNSVKNVKRIVKLLMTDLATRGAHVAPVIAVASLTPTKRLNQRFFIRYMNDLMAEQKSAALPLYVKLDKISKSYISSDGLHPKSSGYAKIAQIMENYFEGKGAARALALRPDSDADGVYDTFETSKYGTNPSVADTDGDGISDGDEIFRDSTDPNDALSHS